MKGPRSLCAALRGTVVYDDLNPERYESGICIGLVLSRLEDRMKVVFVYETGEAEIAWLNRYRQDRWIDNYG
jgi:hypothetical protein